MTDSGSTSPLIALIPARGGSKGLPGKNIRPLAGLPLIAHSIRCAKSCPQIDRVVVTTDSPEIAGVAADFGAEVPFLRPAELAQDQSAMWPVVQHAVTALEEAGGRVGRVVLLDPTSPGRLPSDIAQAAAMLSDRPDADGVIGVSEPEFNPRWHCVALGKDGWMTSLMPEAESYARRQDVPPVYRINASLYLWRRDFVMTAGNWRSGKLLMLPIPEARAIHIDDIFEFRKAEALIACGLIELPWLGS